MELIVTALIMGIAGAGHCTAMCGSLSVAAGFAIPKERSFTLYAFMMSFGRIFGYGVVAVIFHLFAITLLKLTDGLVLFLPILASILMLGVALHILQISHIVLKTEKLGALIDPLLIPLKKKLFPLDTISKAISYGFLWGFLPCGLVYSALGLAITAQNTTQAFMIMLSFGVGTLPTLVGLTAFSTKLKQVFQNSYFRVVFGGLIFIMAIYHFVIALQKILAFY